ncbi:MAG TPA: DinB family protein [Acidimicrobiales bacterium]|jgi:uncharacterized damage-inducible protein DinB|nr:DinB family protein [Acidimicrobiales bacterium]
MADRRTPFANTGEKATLLAFLDYLRESVVLKVDGLDETQARWSPVPSGTSLLGLLKHLTMVEVAWFHWAFAGLDVPVPDGAVAEADALGPAAAAYRAAWARSNELLAEADDLDRLCARPGPAPQPMSLRWVLAHMVEETGRHAGHADIVRELLDGTVGR